MPRSSLSQPSPTTRERSPEEVDQLCRLWARHAISLAHKFNSDPETESDALLGLWKAARSWDPSKSGFKTYLAYRVSGEIKDGFRDRDHLSRNARKKDDGTDERLHRPLSFEELQAAMPNWEVADPAPDVFVELAQEAELARRVEALFAYASMALDWRSYEVLHLYYREGLRLHQIGKHLGVTESRVCQIINRAERILKEQLNG